MKKQNIQITLPYNYQPRPYQIPFWKAFDSGKFKRFLFVWHRRAGKDKYIDHFPKEMIDGKPNATEMKIRYKNGSVFQVIGTDGFNEFHQKKIQKNVAGVVFSEFALQDPKAWDFICIEKGIMKR